MMPVRSLLHPRLALEIPESEHLPPYSPPARSHRLDPETSSILSAAPSYSSEAPPYSPRVSTTTQRYGLPALERYAPGFQSRAHGSVADIQNHNFNIANWSTIRTGHRMREYENVARRRAQRDIDVSHLLNNFSAVPAPTLTPIMTASGSAASAMIAEISESSARTYPTASTTRTNPRRAPASVSTQALSSSSASPAPVEAPFSPLEDPALVGEVAAARAKSSRLYREAAMRDPLEVLRNENKGWDFMLHQMRDWEERGQSWTSFRKEAGCGRRMKLARRIGIKIKR
ncbi:hypothetical protein E2P81_ATG03232 [Venturia nashicola]|uniref:Uncharacterized protein n=1 Tax=Venturia nashicola TaxID=86259 RepID=A0A4Z1PN50_9PEZI|nr:hypothetical protein E6O75_ATG03300 [Venturia nashicola]TLD36343.1 hypothetical protein E2P81_ATG03232 [Venturia nashicola]